MQNGDDSVSRNRLSGSKDNAALATHASLGALYGSAPRRQERPLRHPPGGRDADPDPGRLAGQRPAGGRPARRGLGQRVSQRIVYSAFFKGLIQDLPS